MHAGLTQAASAALLALVGGQPSSRSGGGLDAQGRRRLVVEAGGVTALVGALQPKAGEPVAACRALLALFCPEDAKGCGSRGGVAKCCGQCARAMRELHGSRGDTRLLGCLPLLQAGGAVDLLRGVLLLLERMLLYGEHVQDKARLRRARDGERRERREIFGEEGDGEAEESAASDEEDAGEEAAGAQGHAGASGAGEDGAGMRVRSSLVRANGCHAIFKVLEKARDTVASAAAAGGQAGGEVAGGGGWEEVLAGGGRELAPQRDVCDVARRLLLRLEG